MQRHAYIGKRSKMASTCNDNDIANNIHTLGRETRCTRRDAYTFGKAIRYANIVSV